MKILTYLLRIIVGSLFIVSGLIKANDTLGFSYKLEEYFENGALAYRVRDWFGWDTFSLEFLVKYALLTAIVMCAAEIVLGFSLLFGTKIKTTLYSLLILTVAFFFLTLHTATCDPNANYTNLTTLEKSSPAHAQMLSKMAENNKIVIVKEKEEETVVKEELPVQCVSDCGCFGDAMKGSLGRSLTPWESWTKDFILIILIVPIFLYRKNIKINTNMEDTIFFGASIAFVLFFSWVFNWYFPLLFFTVGYLGFFASKRLLFNTVLKWIPIIWIAVISIAFIYYTYNHLPLKDYRAYAVGKNIPQQMVLPKGAVPDIYSNIFIYRDTITNISVEFYDTDGNTGAKKGYYLKDDSGNYKLMSEEQIPWNIPTNTFVDRETKLVKAGDKTEITDFTITADDGSDYSQDYFNEEAYVFMLVAYDISKTKKRSIKKINTFVDRWKLYLWINIFCL